MWWSAHKLSLVYHVFCQFKRSSNDYISLYVWPAEFSPYQTILLFELWFSLHVHNAYRITYIVQRTAQATWTSGRSYLIPGTAPTTWPQGSHLRQVPANGYRSVGVALAAWWTWQRSPGATRKPTWPRRLMRCAIAEKDTDTVQSNHISKLMTNLYEII